MNRIGRIERESAAAVAHMVLIEHMAFELMAEWRVERMAAELVAELDLKAELSKLQTAIR